MKKIYLVVIAFMLQFVSAHAQKVLSNGFPGVGVVNGTTYTRTGTIGTMNYMFVAANATTGFASGQAGKLYFIDLASETISDSMAVSTRDLAMSEDSSILMAIRGEYMYRINVTTKTVLDSTHISSAPFRIVKRPGVKEAWISDSIKVFVINYASGITQSSFVAGVNQYDYGAICFTASGSTAYRVAPVTHRVYKIDANTKTVVDSITLPGGNNDGITLSSDSARLFVANPNDFKIYVVKTSDMSLMDSINSPREPFALYHYPTRAEIWCINHFDDSLTVYKESDYTEIAAFDLPPSPHYLAFINVAIGVNDIAKQGIDAMLYPNPAKQQITLSLPMGERYSIVLSDNTGRTLQSIHTAEPMTTIQVAHLPAGIYHIRLANDKGAKQHLQWVKYEQ